MVIDLPVSHLSWSVSWTRYGDFWYERWFYTFEEAQGFARELMEENDCNPGFNFYAERMMTVNRMSFLDAETAGAVELAPHLLATADTFE